ncbi:hypothetical protein [Streptomyces sp. SudanB52_2052]
MRSRLAASTIASTVTQWIDLARFLHRRRICTLADADTAALRAYGLHLKADATDRRTARGKLRAISRLYAYDQLTTHPTGIARPPWDVEELADDYLPQQRGGGGENTTEPLATATIASLLTWSLRLVEDLADDILGAASAAKRLAADARTNPTTGSGAAALEQLLLPLLTSGAPLPATTRRGRPAVARTWWSPASPAPRSTRSTG